MDLNALRKEYRRATLDESTVANDPIEQFVSWFKEAEGSGVVEPNAMTLATVAQDGRPSARVVLLKGVGEDGFIFYTDYRSRKARELEANPHAALVSCRTEDSGSGSRDGRSRSPPTRCVRDRGCDRVQQSCAHSALEFVNRLAERA